jgi:uncharacterized membrane protein YjjP (DUF1212 family)
MVQRLVKKAMKKSNSKDFLPESVTPQKIIDEIAEHFNFLKWNMKRVVLPLIIFYIIAGLFLEEYVMGAAFTALIAFFYTNFLPDMDAFFSHNHKEKARKANWFEKRIVLFLAPLVIYYTLSRKIKPLYIGSQAFHNKRALMEFSVFLFVFGLTIYFSALKAFFLMLFGFLGFLTHLIVDKNLK